jgi:RimJ/RimL family protein N-acetyltransferase
MRKEDTARRIRVSYLALPEGPARPAENACPPGIEVARQLLRIDEYLALYRAVGGPWGWDQRLKMPRGLLADFLAGPHSHIFTLRSRAEGSPALGFCEFDSAGHPDVQLVNFGMVPEAYGRRLGPCLLAVALRAIWDELSPRRIWLHTDVWDHPKAMDVYLKAGFVLEEVRNEDPTEL